MKQQNHGSLRCTKLAEAVRIALLSAAASTLLVAAPAAHAQASPGTTDAGASSADADRTDGIQTVLVTAKKRSDTMQNVPMSMSVVGVDKLLNTGQSGLSDYYATVPGLSMNDRGSGRSNLVVRGISAGDSLNPTVGVSIDDVPYGSSTMDYAISNLDPFDIERIEVLRGPQGTLYGASSMGGLIKFVMVQPTLDQVSGRVQAGVSSTEHGGVGYVTRAAVNLPLVNDKFGIRLSAFKRRDAGYVDDPGQQKKNVNDGNVDGFRLSSLWQPTASTSVRASVMNQEHETGSSARVDMRPNSYTPLYGAYDHRRLPGTDGSQTRTRVYTFEIDSALGWADFSSVSSYNRYELTGPQDVTGTFSRIAAAVLGVQNAGVKIINNAQVGKFSQELRLASPDDDRKLSWLAGAFFTNEHASAYQGIRAVNGTSGEPLASGFLYDGDSPSQFKETAVFGNLTYTFTPQFDVQVGGRFSAVRQQFDSTVSGPLAGGEDATSNKARSNIWTYSVSPRYRISADMMTYARVATGYRAGGVNSILPMDLGQFPNQYDSDTLTSYEWGFKGTFPRQRLSLDASLFYINWKDIQLNTVSQVSSTSYTVNASSAKSEGAEATLRWRPIRQLMITTSGSYTHAVLTEPTPNGTHGNSGDRLPFSPRWSGTVSADYTFPVSDTFNAEIGAAISYVGDRMSSFTSSAAATRFNLASYATSTLYAGISSDAWHINLYARNLADKRGFLSATSQNATTGVSSNGLLLIQPRTIGVTATYAF